MSLKRLIDGALGQTPPDLVVANGQIVDVYAQELRTGSVAILGDRIIGVGDLERDQLDAAARVIDASGSFLVPGFIDAHFHVGGSSLSVAALSRALLERGTTTLATDLYEIYTIAGAPGVRACIEEARGVGLNLLLLAPLHLLGLEEYGTFKHAPDTDEFLEMVEWPETIGVNEPPPFVVLRGNLDVLAVITRALELRKVFEGHAVGIEGASLQAYAAAGASSDHESQSAQEALAKLRLGYRIIMREGSASRDLTNLVTVIASRPELSRFFMVCSDETEPRDLVREGHVDHKLRLALAHGVDPVVAIQLATINVADYFGLAADVGSLTPGKRADVLLVRDLERFSPELVIASGNVVVEERRFTRTRRSPTDIHAVLQGNVDIGGEIAASDFGIETKTAEATTRVRVIGLRDGTLVSDALEHECKISDGLIASDPQLDVLKVAVVERHTGSRRIGRAFMSGVKLHAGAVAMTYCHVHHNLLVVGASEEEMAVAATEVSRLGGGIAVSEGTRILRSLRLPIGGIFALGDLGEVHAELSLIEDALRSLGCQFSAPILSLSFSVLPHIPAYGLTDFGLYDTAAQAFVDVEIG